MNVPLLSQIPNVILKKLNPDDFREPNQKKVKFLDSIDEITILDDHEEVTSSYRAQSEESETEPHPREKKPIISKERSPIRTRIRSNSDSIESNNAKRTAKEKHISTDKHTLEEILEEDIKDVSPKCIQIDHSDSESNDIKKLVNTGTQTVESSFENVGEGKCDQCQARMDSLSRYKPVYSFPRKAGEAPPLKLGLTLPKGRKRKVFYPDEEKELAEGC